MFESLTPGDSAPQFALADSRGECVRLADYLGTNVVVYFYPKAATPGCTTQACDFRDSLGALQRRGYNVLGISPDEVDALRSFSEDQELTFPLLSDSECHVARAWGAFGVKKVDGKSVEGVLRSTVVLNHEGTVIQADYGVNPQGHVAELLQELEVTA